MLTLKIDKYRKNSEFSETTKDKVTKKNVGPKPKANEEILKTRLLSFVVSVEMLFLLWGIHLCYKVRKAPSAFNESKFISWSIYNLTVVTLLLKITRYEVCDVIVSRCHDFASSAGIARDALASARKKAKHSTSRDSKGVVKGGPGVTVIPLLQALFNQRTYNRWRKCQSDNLVSTLTLTQCDPSFEKSWLRPCDFQLIAKILPS